jgi:uncharacterized membrane protein (UPF0127 family)
MQPILQHLPFPFSKKATIQLTTGKKTQIIECELASSVIEIFQSLCFRKKNQFKQPLLLKFDNPLQQTFSRQTFSFDVIQACFDYETGLAKKIAPIRKSSGKAAFVQSFAEFSYVLLLPADAQLGRRIVVNQTKISIEG